MTYLIALTVLVCSAVSALPHMRYLQSKRYRRGANTHYLQHHWDDFCRDNLPVGLIASLVYWYLPLLMTMVIAVEETRNLVANLISILLFTGFACTMSYLRIRRQSGRMTTRMLRLMVCFLILMCAAEGLLTALHLPLFFAYIAVPTVVMLALRVMNPIEEKLNERYYRQAHEKLMLQKGLIRIGITGSYGKTMTKFILGQLLSAKYNVLCSPASYNTAMGLSQTIMNELKPEHQVFIAEMGAEHKGEIKELTKLIRPHFGLITCVLPRRLDTFGSISNIADACYELVAGVPASGKVFFGHDDFADRLFAKCKKDKVQTGLNAEGLSMTVTEVTHDHGATSFILTNAKGESIPCHTDLIGESALKDIALAASIAEHAGFTLREIADGIAALKPFEHNLQVIKGDQTVIDDTANELPEAIPEALEALSVFGGSRILVMAAPEIDEDERKLADTCYAIGASIRGCADTVILIGDRMSLRQILRGLYKSEFPKSAIRVVAEPVDAYDVLDQISRPGDTILYEGPIE